VPLPTNCRPRAVLMQNLYELSPYSPDRGSRWEAGQAALGRFDEVESTRPTEERRWPLA